MKKQLFGIWELMGSGWCVLEVKHGVFLNIHIMSLCAHRSSITEQHLYKAAVPQVLKHTLSEEVFLILGSYAKERS